MGDRKIVSGDSIRVVSWPLGEGQGKVLSFVEMSQQTKYPTDPTLFSSIVGGRLLVGLEEWDEYPLCFFDLLRMIWNPMMVSGKQK